jgi:hypothetical protein
MVKLGLRDNRTAFSPGDELAGAALWELEAPPKLAEVRLVWSTRGKGTEDAEVVVTVAFDAPLAGDTRPFTLRLPDGPYTFSGKLISLVWAVELVVRPGEDCDRVEIVLAPGGVEVLLPREESQTLGRLGVTSAKE